jgi:hypothetical protein
MDAIREAANAPRPSLPPDAAPDTPMGRFERSMHIDYEKWHDGIGYDVGELKEMSPAERASIERTLLEPGRKDWRDIEALAALDTPAASAKLVAALKDPSPEVRNAVMRHAPQLVPAETRVASLVHGIETATAFGGLSQTLDQVAAFHPPVIVEALLRGALARDGETAVHLAAMLVFVHGKANEPFEWKQRPFFLRFNTADRAERETAFRELCARIGVDPAPYLAR